ncbi:cytochrome c maturation protein CcmE [Pelagibacteraceae bacterium]|jgi:cytochrome c-type biogenesis protein CcmE|nr:cytochrome c maturation protein CcmE [Pelagibacteraceae bacterium]|tara:strand:+ start:422 stop:850 length:429 start_codon:yes stop_codon:yes gene_type:complete
MLTKKVKKRISLISIFFTILVLSIFFILKSLNQNILYFKTPTDINLSEDLKINKSIRVGGMVKKNSITANNENIRFIITDFKNEILVIYSGAVPNLFLEGKGVIAEGKLKDKKYFIAEKILAKHDENYMPPELEGILKKNVK